MLFLVILGSHVTAKLTRLKKRSACSHCLGGVHESHTKCSCLASDISNRSWDTSIIDSLGDQEPTAWIYLEVLRSLDSFGSAVSGCEADEA